MALVRLTTFIVVFVTTCIGLGYFAEFCVRRFQWPRWLLGILVVALAFVWPIAVVVYVWFDAQRYLRQHPHDDAPGMVMLAVFDVFAPILCIASFLPLLAGVAIRRGETAKRDAAAYKSLDRSHAQRVSQQA